MLDRDTKNVPWFAPVLIVGATLCRYINLQITHAEGVKEGVFSSFLQMRGSIPTFWTQESSISIPKPPIVNSRVDPMYSATQVSCGNEPA